jgi:hypothetical protein
LFSFDLMPKSSIFLQRNVRRVNESDHSLTHLIRLHLSKSSRIKNKNFKASQQQQQQQQLQQLQRNPSIKHSRSHSNNLTNELIAIKHQQQQLINEESVYMPPSFTNNNILNPSSLIVDADNESDNGNQVPRSKSMHSEIQC